MVLYHGTKKEFKAFDPSLQGSNTEMADGLKLGFWLTDQKHYAAEYGPVLLEVEVADDIHLRQYKSFDELERAYLEFDSQAEFVAALMAEGYQGVIFPYRDALEVGVFDLSAVRILGAVEK